MPKGNQSMNEDRWRGASPELVQSARELRRSMTPAEKILWQAIRNRNALGCRVRRQHPIGTSVLDFFIPSAAIAIELDGSVHDNAEAKRRDAERTAWLEAQGIRVIRFRNEDVERDLDDVIERIRVEIDARMG